MENKSCGLIVIEQKRGALDEILEQQQGRTMDKNFGYFGRNIGEISDIGDNRSEISHENSFEGKIAEKSEILPIFRRYIGIGPKFRRNFGD